MQFPSKVLGHNAQLPESLCEKVSFGSGVVRVGGKLAEGGLSPTYPPNTDKDKSPFCQVIAHAHDECQANEKQGHRPDVAHDVTSSSELVVFFRGGDFWQISIVESEASPESEVGQKQRSHAPFETIRVEEKHAGTSRCACVAKDLHERQLFASVIRHTAEQRT